MVNQGERLREFVSGKRIPVSVFASAIGVRREYAYELFKKDLLTSDIIAKVMEVYRVPASLFFPASPPVTVVVFRGEVPPDGDITINRSDVMTFYQVPGG